MTRVLGIKRTVAAIEWWVLVSIAGIMLLGIIDIVYATLSLIMLGWWLFVTQPDEQDAKLWSRRVFFSSLLLLVIWLVITTVSALRLLIL